MLVYAVNPEIMKPCENSCRKALFTVTIIDGHLLLKARVEFEIEI